MVLEVVGVVLDVVNEDFQEVLTRKAAQMP